MIKLTAKDRWKYYLNVFTCISSYRRPSHVTGRFFRKNTWPTRKPITFQFLLVKFWAELECYKFVHWDAQSNQISDHELTQEKVQRSGILVVPRIPNLSTRWRSRHFQEPVAFLTRNNSQYPLNRGLDVLEVILDNLQKKCISCRYRKSKSVSSLLEALPTRPDVLHICSKQQKQGLVSQQIITSILGLEKVKWRLKSFRS
jgi:hypothetical protein